MPLDFELDPQERIVQTRAWGLLEDADLYDHLARITELFDAGTLDEGWSQLADFTQVEVFTNLSSDAIRSIADRNPWPPKSKRALVIKSDLGFGLGRMYQMEAGEVGRSLRVFRTVEEARAWLDEAQAGDPHE